MRLQMAYMQRRDAYIPVVNCPFEGHDVSRMFRSE